jgi:hypothetical protein
MIARGGMNPYELPPRAFATDPWFPLVSQVWRDLRTGYGPVWLLLNEAIDRVADDGTSPAIVTTILGLRALFIGGGIASAALIWRIVRALDPGRRAAATVAFAWCPMLLVVGYDHNDVVMLFFALLGIGLQLWRRPTLAAIALTLSALIKYFTIPLLVADLIWLWRSRATSGGRWWLPPVATLGTVVFAFAPFDPAGLVTVIPAYLLESGRVAHVAQVPVYLVAVPAGLLAYRFAVAGQSPRFDQVISNGTLALGVYLAFLSRDWFPWYLVTLLGLAALVGGPWLGGTGIAALAWLVGMHQVEEYVVAFLGDHVALDRSSSVTLLFFGPTLAFVAVHSFWRWRHWRRLALVSLCVLVVVGIAVVVTMPIASHLDQVPPAADLSGGRAPGPVVFDTALEWDDWSWGVSLDQSATSDSSSASRTLCVTPSEPDGSFFAHHPGFSTNGYSTVELQIDEPDSSSVTLALRGKGDQDLGSVSVRGLGQPAATGSHWLTVRVPLTALGAVNTTVNGLILHDGAGRVGQPYCVRNLAFR